LVTARPAVVSPHHRLLRVGRGFNRVGFKSVPGVCGCSGESQVQRERSEE